MTDAPRHPNGTPLNAAERIDRATRIQRLAKQREAARRANAAASRTAY